MVTYLSDCARQGFCLWYIAVSTELMLTDTACLCAHCFDLIIAIIVVFNLLYCQSHRSDSLGKGWHTDLASIGVSGISAMDLWTIPIAGWSMISKGQRH